MANLNAAEQDFDENEVGAKGVPQHVQDAYLDPEGGYPKPEEGRSAEVAAMTRHAPIPTSCLPTKAYLEATITPTVMKALSEVCKARPDNPLEFVAYYILKHNPNTELKNEGHPIGHRHPDDKEPEGENPTGSAGS